MSESGVARLWEVGSCEVQLGCEVRCSTSSQPDKNLYVCVFVCQT